MNYSMFKVIKHGSVWVFSGCLGFLLQLKDMQINSTGCSKLPIGVNVNVNGCLPVIDWRSAQSVSRLSPKLARIGSSFPSILIHKQYV